MEIRIPVSEIELKKGAYFPFGKEGIIWRVLDIDEKENTAIVIADRPVCERKYHGKRECITWENCDLRAWLNGEYFETAFTDEEKAAIISCENKNPDNPDYGTAGGNDTSDCVWLLSLDEAEKYFTDRGDLACGELWWLRTPGDHSYFACYVNSDGSVSYYYSYVDYTYGVRPALKLNLKSAIFESVITERESRRYVSTPDIRIAGTALVDCVTKAKNVVIPEGVTEIADYCFYYCKKLETVTLPSTLVKIGTAFDGCSSLKTIRCSSRNVSWGKDAIPEWRWEMKYKASAELYHTTGKLCAFFTRDTSVCGAEELAYVIMYQKGECWNKFFKKAAEQADDVLKFATEYISSLTSSQKKPATAIGEFVKKNIAVLKKENVSAFLDVLKSIKTTSALYEELLNDPAISDKLNNNSTEDEPDTVVLPDGSILFGKPSVKIMAGAVVKAETDIISVDLPPYVSSISADAFRDCKRLQKITWQSSVMEIDEWAFCDCPGLQLPAEYYLGKKLPPDKHAKYMPTDNPDVLAAAWLKSGVKSRYPDEVIDKLNSENAPFVADAIIRTAAGLKTIKNPERLTAFTLACATAIGAARVEAFAGILSELKLTGRSLLKKLADSMGENTSPEINKQIFYFKPEIFEIGDVICRSKTQPDISVSTLFSVLDYANQYSTARMPDYANPKKEAYKFSKHKKECLPDDETDFSQLSDWLKKKAQKDDAAFYAPYAAFADEAQLKEIIALLKKLVMGGKWAKKQSWLIRGAVLLNDSNDAMRYADSVGLLGQYAEIRNLSEDEVRDSMMSDLGLSEDGKKIWTLAGRTITATLNTDLTLTLSDESGKEIKSIPKRGAEPAEYEAVNEEYKALKKDIKPTAKARNNTIFAEFLSGRKRTSKNWQSVYLKNPLMRLLAQLIVWDQDGKTFILHADGKPCSVDGAEYHISNDEIAVAHPMEMGKKLTKEWQDYFTSHLLRQPFEQIWEPVVDPSLVKPGRYDGCNIPAYQLMNKEKHGIVMSVVNPEFKDCRATLDLVAEHREWWKNEYEVKGFSFRIFTRQVNHIVTHLDKASVAGRIVKDDISVAQWLDLFTLAQIMEFVDLAVKNNATNVTALLLQYKQNNYPDANLLDEFTLDLL